MNRFLYAVMFSQFAFIFAANASECSPVSPKVNVGQLYSGYKIDRSLTGKSLEKLGNKDVGVNGEMMGLTVSGLVYSLQLSTSVMNKGNSYCGTVNVVDVKFGADKPVDVYISSNIPVGSCDDRVTVQHELQHVSFIEQAIISGSSKIKTSIYDYMKGQTFSGSSQNSVVSQAKHMLTAIIDRELAIVTKEMNARHASIDTQRPI
jgi:hypothetical protein